MGKYGYSATEIADAVEIDKDTEIVLRVIIYGGEDGVALYDPQEYAKRPELLKEYDLAYVLKCQFSEETPE